MDSNRPRTQLAPEVLDHDWEPSPSAGDDDSETQVADDALDEAGAFLSDLEATLGDDAVVEAETWVNVPSETQAKLLTHRLRLLSEGLNDVPGYDAEAYGFE